MSDPTEFEVNISCAMTQLATVLDPRSIEDMAKRGALRLRADVLSNPAKYRTQYRFMYPTLRDCLRMWWKSFVQRMTDNPEYGRGAATGKETID
jgi:hypothetical protein